MVHRLDQLGGDAIEDQSFSPCNRFKLDCKINFSMEIIGQRQTKVKMARKPEHLRSNVGGAQMQGDVPDEKEDLASPPTHSMRYVHPPNASSMSFEEMTSFKLPLAKDGSYYSSHIVDEFGGGSCSVSAASSEANSPFRISEEPPIFIDYGPYLTGDEDPCDPNFPSRQTQLVERLSETGLSSSTPSQSPVQASRSESASYQMLARIQKLEDTNQNVRDWLSHESEDGPPLFAESDGLSPILETQYPLDDIPLWTQTRNRRQPGRIYYSTDEGQLDEADKKILASNRNWVDEPMHLAIKSGEPSLPATSANAMQQYQKMCSQTRKDHDAQYFVPLPLWLQRLDRIHLALENARGSQQNQPKTSQEAIARYSRNADEISTASKAATWGTYRPGDQKRSRLGEDTGDVSAAAGPKEASEMWRDRAGEGIRQKVSRDKGKSQVESQGASTDQNSINIAPGRFDLEHNNNDFDIKMILGSQDTDTEGIFEDLEVDSYQHNKHPTDIIDQIEPTIPWFKQHILSLNPSMQLENFYLVERIANHQLARLNRLVVHRTRHSFLGESCPSGSLCPAMGGAAIIDEKSIYKLASDDEETDAIGGSIVAKPFPRGIPMPPTTKLPAEFECQVCYQRKKISRPSDWTDHIREDVSPFSCTWEGCLSSAMFTRKADWARHENERHRQLESWTCDVEDCSHTYFRRDKFVQHLVREHHLPEPKVRNKAAARKDSEKNPFWEKVEACHSIKLDLPKDEPCRFCGETFLHWSTLISHVAEHMKQISLPILRLVERVADDPGLTFVPGQGFLPGKQPQESRAQPFTDPFFGVNFETASLDDHGPISSSLGGDQPLKRDPPSELMSNCTPDSLIGKTVPNKRTTRPYEGGIVNSEPSQTSLPALSSHIGPSTIESVTHCAPRLRTNKTRHAPDTGDIIAGQDSANDQEHETQVDENRKEFVSISTMPTHQGDCDESKDPAAHGNSESDTSANSPTATKTDRVVAYYDLELSAIQKEQDSVPLHHSTVAGTVLQTDSGYASLKKRIDEKQRTDVNSQEAGINRTTIVTELDDAATEYTNADSVGTLKRESDVLDFAEDLCEQIIELHSEQKDMENISELMPHILKALVFKMGLLTSMPVYKDIMYFVHKYRRYLDSPHIISTPCPPY